MIITRANTKGIFNIVSETTYDDNNSTSPVDTEWSFGTTANISSLTFEPWELAINNNPPGSLGLDMVVHLITDDIYIDIKFTAWGQGQNGGLSFTYERSTGGTVRVLALEMPSFELFPSPTSGELSILLAGSVASDILLEIYATSGNLLESRNVVPATDRRVDVSIRGQKAGLYFVRLTTQGRTITKRLVLE